MRVLKYSLLIFGVILLSDLSSAQVVRTFGEFVSANSISLDPHGNIYVADVGANTVKKFSKEGVPIAEIGGYGWGQLEFDQPYEVCAINGLDVFVADYGNHRVQRFNRKLEYIATLFTRNSNEEFQRFGYPTGVAINRFGDLFICDNENRRVLKVSGFNRVMNSIGGIDAGKGRLVNPQQVEIGVNDKIFVLENRRIVVFDNFGNYLYTVGADTLRAATGMTVGRSSMFVADRESILEFTLDGKLVDLIPCSSITQVKADGGCVDIAADETRLVVLFRQFGVIVSR